MKRVTCVVLGVATLLSLGGCSAGSAKEITDIPAMTVEEVAGKRLLSMTNEEREGEIYQFVSDRIVVDKERLIDVDSHDEQAIRAVFSKINNQLCGSPTETILTEEYANYLLTEFAKTPYQWQQSSVNIVGFDPAARLYFVDVTYKTTNNIKEVVPSSKIPNGAPDADTLRQKRYADYINLLNYQYRGDMETYPVLLQQFETAWGSIDTIMDEQQGVSLLSRTQEKAAGDPSTNGIGRLTYTGLVVDSRLYKPAVMTIRYVMKYRLNLGEETDMMVSALYLKDYTLSDPDTLLSSYKLDDAVAIEVLRPFIDQLILSYNKAVEESNNIGLYQLFKDYGGIDKYYDELRSYTYNSIGAYTYKILSRSGSDVAVQVNRVNQIRAKGANMSLPTYDETLIFNLLLDKDDTIRIKSIYPIKITLIGEPLSVIKNVSGISDIIQYGDVAFTDANKAAVEEVLKTFSSLVLNGDVSSEKFLSTVDLGVSQSTLTQMVDTMTSINANSKVTYIVSWDTKTNVYCSLTLRELFECDSGNFDTESVISLVNRNNEWRVVNYVRTMNIKATKTTIDGSNAFCIDER